MHRPQFVNRLGLAPIEVALHRVPSAALVGVTELIGDLGIGVALDPQLYRLQRALSLVGLAHSVTGQAARR